MSYCGDDRRARAEGELALRDADLVAHVLDAPRRAATESLNRTKTSETFSRDQEKTRSMPEMAETASSIGRVTVCSMSSGLAPG